MRKKKPVAIITILAVITIVLLQSIWMYNTYMSVYNDIYDICNNVVLESVEENANSKLSDVPKGSEIHGPINDDLSDRRLLITYLANGVDSLGFPLSIHEIDSIANRRLKENIINSTFAILLLNLNDNSIINRSNDYNVSSSWMIKSDIIPILKNNMQGIQLVLINPFLAFFQRMGLIIIATALMMGLIIWSIIYQINIINRQNRIARMRQDFTHALIHDMKTPLSTITASLAILDSEKVKDNEPMRRKFFGIASDEVGHLLSLTNRVLTISKLENQKMDLHRSKVNLLNTISSLIEKFEAKSIKPVRFKTQIQIEEIFADEEMLTEAISNLIDNAIKYSKESVEIQISTRLQEEYVLISVYDNGIGISPKDQRVIFDKFERAAAGKRNLKIAPSGFGLGLNYVYLVAEAHGGHVGVNSLLGEFSEFIIFIPKIMEDYQDDQTITD